MSEEGYNSADDEAIIKGETGVRLVPRQRTNMAANTLEEWSGLREHRERIETVGSQLEA